MMKLFWPDMTFPPINLWNAPRIKLRSEQPTMQLPSRPMVAADTGGRRKVMQRILVAH